MQWNKGEEALEICNELIEIQPMESNNYYIRSRIYYALSDLNNALIL